MKSYIDATKQIWLESSGARGKSARGCRELRDSLRKEKPMLEWTAVERGKVTRYYEVHQRDISKNGHSRLTVICRVSDMGTQQAQAAAHLIAAAPKMKEALQEITKILPTLKELQSVKAVLGVLE